VNATYISTAQNWQDNKAALTVPTAALKSKTIGKETRNIQTKPVQENSKQIPG